MSGDDEILAFLNSQPTSFRHPPASDPGLWSPTFSSTSSSDWTTSSSQQPLASPGFAPCPENMAASFPGSPYRGSKMELGSPPPIHGQHENNGHSTGRYEWIDNGHADMQGVEYHRDFDGCQSSGHDTSVWPAVPSSAYHVDSSSNVPVTDLNLDKIWADNETYLSDLLALSNSSVSPMTRNGDEDLSGTESDGTTGHHHQDAGGFHPWVKEPTPDDLLLGADPTLAHHLSPASWSYLIPGDLADVLSTGNNNNYDNGVYPQEAALQEYWEAQIGADPGWSGAESSEYSPGPDDLETESESPDIRFKLDPTAATRSPSARSPTYSGQTPSSAGASSTIPYSYTQRGVSSTPSTSSKSTSLHPSTALHASDVPRTASGRAIKQNRPHADFVRDKAKAVRNDTGDVFLRVFDMVARHSYADADLLIGEAVKGLKSELAGLKVNQSEVDEWERAGEQEGRDVAGQVVELTRRVAGSRTPGRIRPEPRRARPSFGGQQPQSSEFHQDSHYPF